MSFLFLAANRLVRPPIIRRAIVWSGLASAAIFLGPVGVLAQVRDVTAPGDLIVSFGGSSPVGQTVEKAIDNTTQKHLNHGVGPNGNLPLFVGPAGFVVTPSLGSTILRGVRVYPADDVPARDPVAYVLAGSRDGSTFTTICIGSLALPAARNASGAAIDSATQPFAEVDFENTEAFTSYRFSVNSVKTPASANSYQVAEIELLGVGADEWIVVTTTSDEDNGSPDPALGLGTSLREAINFANSRPSDDTIVLSATAFAAPRKTILLTQPLTITAAGHLTITAPPAGLELTGNNTTSLIIHSGHSTITGLVFRDGRTTTNSGGAIRHTGTALVLERCAFYNNSARAGGAVFANLDAAYTRSLTMRNCTLTGNSATISGGAIGVSVGRADLESCTITGNSAPFNAGGGVAGASGPPVEGGVPTLIRVRNCIIAGNTSDDVDSVGNTRNGFESLGFNLIGDGNAISAFSGNLKIGNASPGLLPFQGNGGPTPTFALPPGHVAVNAGSTTLTEDQRGVSRPRGTAADIGAFELVEPIVSPAVLATGIAGEPFAETLTASTGTAPYTFALSSGELPRGLSLSSSGLVSGTPQYAGSFSFTVLVTDAAAGAAQRTLTATIAGVSAPVADCAAAWYRAEGNGESFSGAAATIVGGVTFAAGQTGQAFSFNGGAGYVALPDNVFPYPTAGQTGSTPFSFELWFKTSTSGVILGQQEGAPFDALTGNYVPALYVGTNGQLRGSLFFNGIGGNLPALPGIVNDNRWHHVAFTYGDGGNLMRIYLDGQLANELETLQYGYAANYRYQLGTGFTTNWPFGAGGWMNFNGLIDEIAIYRRALTASEVHALHAAGQKGKSKIPTLSISRNNDNSFNLHLKGWPGLVFKLQGSETLSAPQWLGSPLRTTDQNGEATFTTGVFQPSTPNYFFRAVEVP